MQSFQHRCQSVLQCLTVCGQGNVPAAAVKQRHAQFLFQPADTLGERGLCNVQLLRRACHVLVLCHCIKVFQL